MEKVELCQDCHTELECAGIIDEENHVIGYYCPNCKQSYIKTEDGFLYKVKEVLEAMQLA